MGTTATPYLLLHDPAEGGKLAHYLLRWVNSSGEPGPWSETVTATIGGKGGGENRSEGEGEPRQGCVALPQRRAFPNYDVRPLAP